MKSGHPGVWANSDGTGSAHSALALPPVSRTAEPARVSTASKRATAYVALLVFDTLARKLVTSRYQWSS